MDINRTKMQARILKKKLFASAIILIFSAFAWALWKAPPQDSMLKDWQLKKVGEEGVPLIDAVGKLKWGLFLF